MPRSRRSDAAMPRPSARARASDASGQASVELVALLPLLGVVALAVWQAALAGQAAWAGGTAARAAARAAAVGADPERAAARLLPASLRDDLRVRTADDGEVTITIGVRSVVGGAQLASFTDRARFAPQR
jgi:hypothetical protein